MSARKRPAEENAGSQPPPKSRRAQSPMRQDDRYLDEDQTACENRVYMLKLYSRKKARSNDYNPYGNDNIDYTSNAATSSSHERQEDVEVQGATTMSDAQLPNPALEFDTNVRVDYMDNIRIEYMDDKYAEHDEFASFHWLEPIDVFVVPKDGLASGTSTSCKQIGSCMAKLVRKEEIRAQFHKNMRKPYSELTLLAFDIFDRYGRLRNDYRQHPVRKGSGLWNSEMDTRDILLIEDVYVDERYRGQGIGSSMIGLLLEVVTHKTRGQGFVTIVWPESRKESRFHQTMENLVGHARAISTIDYPDIATTGWFRNLGFRRIGSSIWLGLNCYDEGSPRIRALLANAYCNDGLAVAQPTSQRRPDKSKEPPSIWIRVTKFTSAIAAEDDYNPAPPMPNTLPERINQAATSSPAEFFKAITAHFFFVGSLDTQWFATNSAGNSILHLAAFTQSSDAIDWILKRPCGADLLRKRNVNGDTPLETLQFKLEKTRTRQLLQSSVVACSDQFEHYDYGAVQCLVKLKGLKDPSWNETQRLGGGCTCGECIHGCLSPRMRLILEDEAESTYLELSRGLASMSGTTYFEDNEYLLTFQSDYCKKIIQHNKSVRRGLVSLSQHVYASLCGGLLPDEDSIMYGLSLHEDDQVNYKNFFKAGGSVEGVLITVFKRAIENDERAGDHYSGPLDGELAQLPICRNDHEYGYVSRRCGYWLAVPF
ncbi:hypothetical protein LTR10_023116 [Elasticomyces elasticus]|uniref:N-acetyltransferase domain-containing protein n=1 Tax=Exophiala sideris TaxID=1016849 RepID=A0ABR0J3C8_9EURO|nr:hypothetical protein LTR10_023116 [Elasticomyces elasticus]KAK5024456.1 hypothetical protein LTS07_008747 [Exophiala sideris]KAK5030862.1 hypothetical protein LTR13_007875 [Exophiala sideris]KAK5054189.1 hypothetical protein LTR69_009151 [Exophiala sideris]KAK5179455.1 hypothetical protein LTR44_007971 [Eurotiomycetes sp. CCFEE 6388]